MSRYLVFFEEQTFNKPFFFFSSPVVGLCCSVQASLVASRLSYPKACGILVPQPGIEPKSPALQGRFLTTGLITREVPTSLFFVENV